MHRPSILLPITGSEESRYAAELCWKIAEKTGGKVLTQHVVDCEAVSELLRHDAEGMIGSRPCADAYGNITKELHSLAGELLKTCVARGVACHVETRQVIDEGNPMEEICRRAAEHDLVIVGHHRRNLPSGQKDVYSHLKYSITDGLVHNCSRPLLVVQHQYIEPGTLNVVVTMDQANTGFIAACLHLALLLGMRPQLLCIACNTHSEESQNSFRKAIHELACAPVRVHMVGQMLMENAVSFVDATGGQEIAMDPSTNLLVIPTTGIGTDRRTMIGVQPALLLQNPTPPNVLFWPEEHFPDVATMTQLLALRNSANKV